VRARLIEIGEAVKAISPDVLESVRLDPSHDDPTRHTGGPRDDDSEADWSARPGTERNAVPVAAVVRADERRARPRVWR
jgi:hypothetical protein